MADIPNQSSPKETRPSPEAEAEAEEQGALALNGLMGALLERDRQRDEATSRAFANFRKDIADPAVAKAAGRALAMYESVWTETKDAARAILRVNEVLAAFTAEEGDHPTVHLLVKAFNDQLDQAVEEPTPEY